MPHKNKNYRKNLHAFDEAVLRWRAPEYTHHEKSALWFAVAGLLALVMVIYGIMTDGWTFSIAVIVFAGAYYSFYRSKPPVVDVKVSKMGVKIGRHVFPYGHLKAFWIIYNPPFTQRLYLRMASRFNSDVFVSLEDVSPSEVRRVLSQYLEEFKGGAEPFSDTLVRIFKL